MHKLLLIMNLRTAIVAALAVSSTWVCRHFDLTANFSTTFLLTAVVFPLAFSINSAYERREKALKDYAALKGNGRALYLALRDWIDQSSPGALKGLRDHLEALLNRLEKMLIEDQTAIGTNQIPVYQSFSDLSHFIRSEMRQQNMAPTEISRVSSYLSEMILAVESIKHIHQYRTPVMLKMFGTFFVALIPVVYGPYFAHAAQNYSGGLFYVMPLMYSVVLTALVNIQNQLENPFDRYGEDDVVFHTDRFIASLEKE